MPKPPTNILESAAQGISDWWGDLTQNPAERANQKLMDAGAPAAFNVNPMISENAAAFANIYSNPAANPFDLAAADAMKQQQNMLVQLMQNTLGDASVAESQGRRAQERNVMQGARAMSSARMPTQAANVGEQVGQVGADLAEQTGQNRNQEQFTRMDRLGKVAGTVQQADLASQRANWQSALRAQALQDEKYRFYNNAYTDAMGDVIRKGTAYKDLESQLYSDQKQKQQQAVTKPLETLGTAGQVATKVLL